MRFWLSGPQILNGLVFITAFALCGVTNAKADQLPKFSQSRRASIIVGRQDASTYLILMRIHTAPGCAKARNRAPISLAITGLSRGVAEQIAEPAQ
jgi:hypothetical protein